MKPPKAICDLETGVRFWREAVGACNEVALVANPSYVASPYDVYPLANRNPAPLDSIAGFVMDMDGTTTTTEPLCLHSLEWMVRAITDRPDPKTWAGLDHERDHPHVIGNSTTRHVEYLLRTYADAIRPTAFRRSFVKAVLWTLAHGRDPGRRREVEANATALGLREMLAASDFAHAVREGAEPFAPGDRVGQVLADRYAGAVALTGFADQVRAAVDIYYVRYHAILAAIHDGRTGDPALGLDARGESRLVAPMPGVGVFLAIVKGWLGEQAGAFYDALAEFVRNKTGCPPAGSIDDLRAVGRWFAAHPARVAVVTSSIEYEADIVLAEVFRALRAEALSWPSVSADCERAAGGFLSHRSYYDAFITASDSSEIRLKPHRDLYSIALYRMGIGREDYGRVVGFEDSESGVIAIRAAGIGCSVALPFAQSAGHDFTAATHVLCGQLPEVVVGHNCMLSRMALGRSR